MWIPGLILALSGCGIGLRDLTVDDTGVRADTGDTGLVTADTATDPLEDGLGAEDVTGLVEFTLLQVACPDCFGVASSLVVGAQAAFHPPERGSWIGWMPPMGTCGVNASPRALSTAGADRGQFVYLESGSKSVALTRTAGQMGTIYTAQSVTEPDYLRNASWDVVVGESGARIPGGLLTTEGFDAIQPQEMLYVEPGAAFSAIVQRSGQRFTWAPFGSGNRFVILVDGYDGVSGAFLGTLTCVGPDNGAMTIPGSQLSVFPSGSLLGVGLYRYRTSTATVPADGSSFESVSWVGVLGTAQMY